ncbi:glycosyltransferase family 2 protein [Hyphomonas sp. WL0036]|uniref:glycosyltransferase family 2 protein n=1 Tax=Hyphomonas sediminis TaxID=2866160 RepID=UPI001C7EF328|nr:glycosyltransferase family 2 protein [Hyphomonas sediminis]MBY9066681.1 glycosyltransferase family 2 protein [Hyphomonas sediminis]
MPRTLPELSVVIPFFNESGNIAPLFSRLLPVLSALQQTWEIVCIDDGSRDDTHARLIAASASAPGTRVIKLSRNFGKEAAITAGIDAARGAHVLIMDGDLQHPPELLPAMLALQADGFDVVYGLRRSRKTDGAVRGTLSRLFYRIFAGASEVAIPAGAGDFRLLSRRAVDALKSLPEQNRFMKGLYAWIGFAQTAIPYDVEARRSGNSKWSLRRLFSYAWGGLVSFSTLPLRVWTICGSVIALLACAYAAWIVLSTLVHGKDVPGFATLAAAIFFLGGLQLLSIGVLGEYIARIFAESKRRPVYIVEEEQESPADAAG